MYAAKVRLGLNSTVVEDAPAEQPDVQAEDVVGFSAGNPRVEHITGIVHLFRTVPNASQDVLPAPALPVCQESPF